MCSVSASLGRREASESHVHIEPKAGQIPDQTPSPSWTTLELWRSHLNSEPEAKGFVVRCQGLSDDKDFQTTMVYMHVLNHGGRGVQSPLDPLRKAGSSENGRIMPAPRSA